MKLHIFLDDGARHLLYISLLIYASLFAFPRCFGFLFSNSTLISIYQSLCIFHFFLYRHSNMNFFSTPINIISNIILSKIYLFCFIVVSVSLLKILITLITKSLKIKHPSFLIEYYFRYCYRNLINKRYDSAVNAYQT